MVREVRTSAVSRKVPESCLWTLEIICVFAKKHGESNTKDGTWDVSPPAEDARASAHSATRATLAVSEPLPCHSRPPSGLDLPSRHIGILRKTTGTIRALHSYILANELTHFRLVLMIPLQSIHLQSHLTAILDPVHNISFAFYKGCIALFSLSSLLKPSGVHL